MPEHDLEKLLGGFAADTLTPDEKQRLYHAALQDQHLFNALADEQALKELLADPAVRQRLLQALKQPRPSEAEGTFSWLDWFRRPANLALAGGLATAVFAVVLGAKLYQDSLKQASTSLATEEMTPATPPSAAPSAPQPGAPSTREPAPKDTERLERPIAAAKKDASANTMAQHTAPALPHSEEPRAPATEAPRMGTPNEQDRRRSQGHSPEAGPDRTVKDVAAPADEKIATTAPPPVASLPLPPQAPISALADGSATPMVSARALFYSGRPERAAAKQAQAEQSMAKPAPRANRLEGQLERASPPSPSVDALGPAPPLGLRYSIVRRGSDGQDREVDAVTAPAGTEPMRLTVEPNQPAYLQVWLMGGTSATKLLFPEKGSGQISIRIAPGQRQSILLPTEHHTGTFVIRLSLVPFGPISRQEAAMLDRPASDQILESVTSSATNGQAEQATYVISTRASSIIQIAITLPANQ